MLCNKTCFESWKYSLYTGEWQLTRNQSCFGQLGLLHRARIYNCPTGLCSDVPAAHHASIPACTMT